MLYVTEQDILSTTNKLQELRSYAGVKQIFIIRFLKAIGSLRNPQMFNLYYLNHLRYDFATPDIFGFASRYHVRLRSEIVC